jgi:D-arabinonate dehydratase
VLRVTDEAGVHGLAAGLLRGATPTGEIALASGALIDRSFRAPGDLWEVARQLLGTSIPRELMRVLSLFDVALWDCHARSAGIPLHQAIGGEGAAPNVLVYGGFGQSFARELSGYVEAGAWGVKIARAPGTVDAELARLRVAREAIGPSTPLVLDVGWGWSSVAEALPYARAFEEVRLAWLEDPFALHAVGQLGRLRAATSIPLGAGDEWSEPAAFERLVGSGSVEVVRVDATYIGGVTGFLRTAALAAERDLCVAAHMHDYLHVHLLAAVPGGVVERATAASGIDPLADVLATTATVDGGRMIPPAGPGLAVDVDWKRLEAHAVEHTIHRD